MDAKSLAKSKRAHSQHHKKHHPNQKAKGLTSSIGTSGTDKAVKEKPRESQGPAALPSNWDRYDNEYDSVTDNQPIDVVMPKSKGADYAYLISEAKSQNSTRPSSEIFPTLDDFMTDYGLGKSSFFTVRGESLLSSIQNDSFIMEDKATASYEDSFLSLDLRALSEQLAKVDLPKRLFMEADLFPPELYSKSEQASPDHNDADIIRNESQASFVEDNSSRTVTNPMVHPGPNPIPELVCSPSENQSKFKPEIAEAELDMLLDSFIDAKLTDSTASISDNNTAGIDIDGNLDDLLNETSTMSKGAPSSQMVRSTRLSFAPSPSQPESKSKLLDDFDSWLDTI